MEKFDHYFSNHIAEKIELETVTIIDYYNPEKGYQYNLRYIFDKKNSSLTITGDFGELIAVNYYNMGEWDTFYNHFTGNPGYFTEKVRATRHHLYTYNQDEARLTILEDYFDNAKYEELEIDDSLILDELFEYFDEDCGFTHVTDDVRRFLSEQDGDFGETLGYAGRHISEYIYLYLDAYRRAYEYLTKEE